MATAPRIVEVDAAELADLLRDVAHALFACATIAPTDTDASALVALERRCVDYAVRLAREQVQVS